MNLKSSKNALEKNLCGWSKQLANETIILYIFPIDVGLFCFMIRTEITIPLQRNRKENVFFLFIKSW